MYGRLELKRGTVSAHVPANGHRDAAVTKSMELAGVELEVDNVIVSARDTPDYPAAANQILTLDMHPGTMEQLVLLMCEKLGWPAFNANEWREIAKCVTRVAEWHGNTPDLLALAERMERKP